MKRILPALIGLLALAPFPALAQTPTPTPTPAPLPRVYPVLKNITYNPNINAVTANFGVLSLEAAEANIPFGQFNFFLPSPPFRGQPTFFPPGYTAEAFSVTFPASSFLEWTLGSSKIRVTNDPALYAENAPTVAPQLAAAFQVQGRLQDAGAPYSGTADVRLHLYDGPTTATLVHAPVTVTGVAVTDGFFSATFALATAKAIQDDQLHFQFETRTPSWNGSGPEPTFGAPSALQPLLPVPQAIHADTARYAQSIPPVTSLSASGGSAQALATDRDGRVWITRLDTPPGVVFPHPFQVGGANGGDPGNGAHVTAGGVWTNASDVNKKTNFQDVSAAEILRKVAELPIKSWTYRNEPDTTRHLGPTAQDFRRAFGLGDEDTTIGTIDADGVSLTAIKALYQENRELRQKLETLEARLQAIEKAQEPKP